MIDFKISWRPFRLGYLILLALAIFVLTENYIASLISMLAYLDIDVDTGDYVEYDEQSNNETEKFGPKT